MVEGDVMRGGERVENGRHSWVGGRTTHHSHPNVSLVISHHARRYPIKTPHLFVFITTLNSETPAHVRHANCNLRRSGGAAPWPHRPIAEAVCYDTGEPRGAVHHFNTGFHPFLSAGVHHEPRLIELVLRVLQTEM